MTKLTQLTIAIRSDDLAVSAYGPDNFRYAYTITLMTLPPRLLVHCEPQFASKQEALDAADKLIRDCAAAFSAEVPME